MANKNLSLVASPPADGREGLSPETATPFTGAANAPVAEPDVDVPVAAPRRRSRRLLWLVPLLAVLAAAAYWGLGRMDGADGITYATTPVVRGDVERTVTSLGSLQPKDYVDVGAQVSGQVRKVYVDIGDHVEKGQLLAEIDDTVYSATVRADQAKIEDLRAQLKQLKASMELAKIQARRNEDLYKETYVSKDTLDSAVTEAKVAEAKVEAIQAQIKQYESSLEEAKANLGYCKIYAPMSGTVSDQTTLEGQTVNANQSTPVILTIADLGTMTAEAEVSEADVVKIRPGMPAWFTILGLPERKWSGVVRQVKPTPETVNDVVLYYVLVDVPNEDGVLMTDMTAQCFFVVEQAKDALVVPLEALGAVTDGQATVRVLGPDGPETRQVAVGVTNRTHAEILSGLQEGDKVITGEIKGAPSAASDKSEGGMPPMPGGGARL